MRKTLGRSISGTSNSVQGGGISPDPADVNFDYLKNVLLKFIAAKDTEVGLCVCLCVNAATTAPFVHSIRICFHPPTQTPTHTYTLEIYIYSLIYIYPHTHTHRTHTHYHSGDNW